MNRRTILAFLVIAATTLLFVTGTSAETYVDKVTLETDHTVNIRSGPGTGYRQIGEAYPGVSFFFTGKEENGFYQIQYPSAGTDPGYVTAYVMQSLASVSPASYRDTIYSSSVGYIEVKPNAQVYLDDALRVKSKGKISSNSRVPYAGVSPDGAYAVLLNRTNDKGEEVVWIGFVSPDDVGVAYLNDMRVLGDMESGMVTGAAQAQGGMLLSGASYDDGSGEWGGWLALCNNTGQEIWSIKGGNTEYYWNPTELSDGRFAVMRCENADEMTFAAQSLMILSADGTVELDMPASVFHSDMVSVGDTLYMVGNAEIGRGGAAQPDTGAPILSHWEVGERDIQNVTIAHRYAALRPQTVTYAEDSLWVGAYAKRADTNTEMGVLLRVDLNGGVIWASEFIPEMSAGISVFDVCVNEDGIIALTCGETISDEEFGDPVGRIGNIIGFDMDGKELWRHSLPSSVVDSILPTQGGFLCVSQGLDLYNCPFLGNGWVLLLDTNGNVKAADVTPDIGGGHIEVYGATKNTSGEALLYGTTLDYWNNPGAPGEPFWATLDFPQAYRMSL